jgi:ectoine hydroxylase-related dioxygenase (phytanoyl-CoA dioxygenase family)
MPEIGSAHEPGAGGPDELRRSMTEDGYLVVRGAVPAEDVRAVRQALVGVLAGAGLVEHSTGDMVAARDPQATVDVHGDPALFAQLYSLELLHRLPHHPRLLALASVLLGDGEVLVHPRPALRAVFPGTPHAIGATSAHQDLLGMQGTPDAYTTWLALTSCPRAGGVLAVAGGSHRQGLRPFLARAGDRVAGCDDAGLDGSWVATDLEPGDALVFHSCTVHRALPNGSAMVRLSIDARYQRAADPVCAATLAERADLPWDVLYQDWTEASAPYRRYWERLALSPVPLDLSLLTPPATAPAPTESAATRKAR